MEKENAAQPVGDPEATASATSKRSPVTFKLSVVEKGGGELSFVNGEKMTV